MQQLAGQTVLVVGLGKSGLAAVRLLTAQGAIVRATDLRAPTPDVLGAAATFVPQDERALAGVQLLVLSPGVPVDVPLVVAARQHGIPVVGEVELASYFLRGKVIGITGSNGKTTTTALIGHILKESGVPVQVGGNIGTAVTALVDTSQPDRWNVLELSSFQLETVAHFRAEIGVCLNVTPDHLDRHHTFAAYAAAKGNLFRTQREDGFAVLNADDPACVAFAALTPAQTMWFSTVRALTSGVWEERGRILCDGAAVLLAKEIPLPGRHNVENVMAAIAAARLAGVALPRIAAAIRTFPGVEHRLEFTADHHGVRYYNDSKATNVDATLKAIEAFPGNLWIILGGKDKDSDYTVLREPLRAKAHAALLIGAAADKIAGQLHGAVPLEQASTLENAVHFTHRHAHAGDVVLLAPACASFDQFDNFEHRGRVFKALVRGFAGQG